MEKPKPQEISASILRGDMGRILDRVKFLEEEHIITKHGKPYAKLVPVGTPPAQPTKTNEDP